jgi:signal peptidase I
MRLLVAYVLKTLQTAALVALLGLSVALLGAVAPSLIGMESTVLSSDLAVVAPAPAEKLAQGDVIVFRAPEALDAVETRRVDSLDFDAARQVRLHTDAGELTVGPRAVLGRVVYLLPRVGAVVSFAGQPLGRVLLLVLPCALLFGDWLRQRARTRTRGQRLLEAARRAQRAGYLELAVTAARGVLQLDPHNAEARAIAEGRAA